MRKECSENLILKRHIVIRRFRGEKWVIPNELVQMSVRTGLGVMVKRQSLLGSIKDRKPWRELIAHVRKRNGILKINASFSTFEKLFNASLIKRFSNLKESELNNAIVSNFTFVLCLSSAQWTQNKIKEQLLTYAQSVTLSHARTHRESSTST